MRIFTRLVLIAISFLVYSCTSKQTIDYSSISTDDGFIAMGKIVFQQNCSPCHNINQDGIGPRLGGITKQVATEWLKGFIKNPGEVITSGDERASALLEKYKVAMPVFGHLSDENIDQVLAYLHTQNLSLEESQIDTAALKDPIPEKIEMSDLVISMELVTSIPASAEKAPKARITKMANIPGSNRMFIVDLRGKLYELVNDKSRVYFDMAQEMPDFIPQPGLATGFGSFAFHPEFLQNGLMYTTHTEPPGTQLADFSYADSIPVTLQWVLQEWKTEAPNDPNFKGTNREMLRVNMVTGIHGVQEVIFNPYAKSGEEDYGLLYIGIGDGGAVEQGYPWTANNIQNIWGTIIRIDPKGNNSKNGKYGIPPLNPFINDTDPKTLREIYCYGFRNPHRITWSSDGKILASNIGQHNIEALNMIEPGEFYGWPVREGTFVMDAYGSMNNVFPLPKEDSIYNITYPVAQYDHDEGNAICGGFEYTGSLIPDLKGKYIFGDIMIGRLFYVEMSDLVIGQQAAIMEWQASYQQGILNFKDFFGNDRIDLRIGQDSDGELYLYTKADGNVYRLTETLSF
ncbi:MAG: PQQ-dependent sugar dehydrogenase [Bacteroidetes bacterium]|nr:PQQ-dependent sugar dehydrogenase [Bacteroidota bacterium]MDA1121265.1 PQQ-dependent sugar dehydrogenase [Bacteroidota bacterium]